MVEINIQRTWSRAVITGAGGFIGSQLVRELRAAGIETIGVDRERRKENDAVTLALDITELGALDPWLNPDTAIFHLAGSANVMLSVEDPVRDFSANVPTTVNVLEAARRAGCAVAVFPSTGSVYDQANGGPYVETSATRPSSPYGAAKIAGEAYCLAYARSYGFDTRIARLFSVYGPGMRRFAIHDFYKRLTQNPSCIMLRGDGGQRRDYMHVSDAARGLIHVATAGAMGEIYNVASGKPRTMREVARAVASVMGLDGCEIAVDGTVNPSEVHAMDADVRKLSELGFKPHYSFEEGLFETIRWLQANVCD